VEAVKDERQMRLGHVPTTIATKAEFWPKFEAILRKQFEHGGDKYSFSQDAEWTDIIRQFDENWVLGTMLKYVGRYKTFHRERDLIKIATYCFILWLQDGYHLQESVDDDTGRDKTEVEGTE
jgi:hypothetical protein